MTRRALLAAGWRGAVVALLAGCGLRAGSGAVDDEGDSAALTARPGPAPAERPPAEGEQPLELEGFRDSLLYLPPGVQPERPAPLVVTLHGAGGDARGGLDLLRRLADQHGLVLLAPASRASTWDGIRRGYGPDVQVINRALERVFEFVAVDPARVGVAGFSDGASYALGLGLANGQLFRRVLAFSPGFVPPARRVGRPAVFVAHGDSDDVLPIGATSRRIVPALRKDGYEVNYREFPGPHTVPPRTGQEAVAWLGWD